MMDEKLRILRYYSFDDEHLVAYWKLMESYTNDDLEYTIFDYSRYQNEMTYSWVSDPDYPVFVQDSSIELNLCFFHDVKACLTVDYEGTYPAVTTGKRYMEYPSLQLRNFSPLNHVNYQISQDDELWFLPNNTECSVEKRLAYLRWDTVFNNWVGDNMDESPAELHEDAHL